MKSKNFKLMALIFIALILIVPTESKAKQTDYSYLKASNTNKIVYQKDGNIKVSLKKKKSNYGYVAIEDKKGGYWGYQIPLGKDVVLPLGGGKGEYKIYTGHSKSSKTNAEFTVAKHKVIKVKSLPSKRYESKTFIILGTQSPQIKTLLNTEFKGWRNWSDTKKVTEVTKYFKKWKYNYNLADYVDDNWYTPHYAVRVQNKNGICYDTSAITASLLRSMGVKTKFVAGYYKKNKTTYHAWNEVYINSKWRTVDNTFNMKSKFKNKWYTPNEPVFEKKNDYIKHEEF